jgi:hypothetical protein
MCKKKKKFQVNERHILDKTKTEKRKPQQPGGEIKDYRKSYEQKKT